MRALLACSVLLLAALDSSRARPAHPEAADPADDVFAPGKVSLEEGVLKVAGVELRMTLPKEWILRMPAGGSLILDNLDLSAQIQMSMAHWDQPRNQNVVRAYVETGLKSASNLVNRAGPVSKAGMMGAEAFAVSNKGPTDPRQKISLHMVGLLHGNDIWYFIVKAPSNLFDKADAQFSAALAGLNISGGAGSPPPADRGRTVRP